MKRTIIKSALSTLSKDQVFTRGELFRMTNGTVKTSTFSFRFNELVGSLIEVIGKVPGSRTLLYRRKS